MVSGFNHITIEAKFESIVNLPIVISAPEIDLKRMLINRKPIILDLAIYSRNSEFLPYDVINITETLNYTKAGGIEYFASNLLAGFGTPYYITVNYNESNVPTVTLNVLT